MMLELSILEQATLVRQMSPMTLVNQGESIKCLTRYWMPHNFRMTFISIWLTGAPQMYWQSVLTRQFMFGVLAPPKLKNFVRLLKTTK